jgi:hypothetical protein
MGREEFPIYMDIEPSKKTVRGVLIIDLGGDG